MWCGDIPLCYKRPRCHWRGVRALFHPCASGSRQGLGAVQHRTQAVADVRASSVHRNFGRQLEASGDVGWVFEESGIEWVSSGSCGSADCMRKG